MLGETNVTERLKQTLIGTMRQDMSMWQEQHEHPGITEGGKWCGLARLPRELREGPWPEPLSESASFICRTRSRSGDEDEPAMMDESPPRRAKGAGKGQGKQQRPAEPRPRTPVGMRDEAHRRERGEGQRQRRRR